MKVLIVEDDEFTSKTITIVLNKEGIEVNEVNNVNDAIAALENFQPDLIITDILMAHTSGLELIGIIKNGLAINMPIIVLSGAGQEKTILEAFELGADDYVSKPFNPKDLYVRVKRLAKKYKIQE